MIKTIWEYIVRGRTYILNGLMAAAFILPEVLNSPEILAVVPHEFQRWFLAATFLLNIWLRPRPAALKSDPEVVIAKQIKAQSL